MSGEEFADFLKDAIEEARKYETCMGLCVCEESMSVELLLDTGVSTYSEWIKGERGDMGLIRCQETNRVVGVRLPLLNEKLVVHHKGPIRINAGFRKVDEP